MPFYEYLCTRCQLRFQKRRAMGQASEPAPCPQCGHPAQRVISAIAGIDVKPPSSIP